MLGTTDILLIIMTLIQTGEMYYILKNHKETNRLISNPGPLVMDGMMQFIEQLLPCEGDTKADIKDKKERQEAFFGFINLCFQYGMSGLKEKMQEVGVPKIRKGHFWEDIGSLAISLPGVQTAVEQKIKTTLGTGAEAVVEQML